MYEAENTKCNGRSPCQFCQERSRPCVYRKLNRIGKTELNPPSPRPLGDHEDDHVKSGQTGLSGSDMHHVRTQDKRYNNLRSGRSNCILAWIPTSDPVAKPMEPSLLALYHTVLCNVSACSDIRLARSLPIGIRSTQNL